MDKLVSGGLHSSQASHHHLPGLCGHFGLGTHVTGSLESGSPVCWDVLSSLGLSIQQFGHPDLWPEQHSRLREDKPGGCTKHRRRCRWRVDRKHSVHEQRSADISDRVGNHHGLTGMPVAVLHCSLAYQRSRKSESRTGRDLDQWDRRLAVDSMIEL